MKKKIFLILLSILLFLIVADDLYALKINVNPPRVELTLNPGEEYSGYITIDNNDETGSLHVRSYVEDLIYLPDGSNDFLPPNSTPWSMADWIKIGPTEFDVPAQDEQIVRYIISVPQGVKGGKYGVVFFEVAVPPADVKETGATVNVRLGAVFLITVAGTSEYKAALKSISASPAKETEGLEISCTVSNDGNLLIRPAGTAKIIDDKETTVAEVEFNKEKGGVLPKTSRTFTAVYDKRLPKGDYFVQVVLDYGGDTFLGGQKKLDIK